MSANTLSQKPLTAKQKGKLNEALVPVSLLRELFDYDPETGILRWRVARAKPVKAGQEAGHLYPDGYRRVTLTLPGKRMLLLTHRIAWAICHGSWPVDELDHISGLKDDNRISNLREVGHKENGKNQRRSKRNTSGVTGVSWNAQCQKWLTRIMHNGKGIYIGKFDDFFEAVAARKSAELKYRFHANHGRDHQSSGGLITSSTAVSALSPLATSRSSARRSSPSESLR